jgi:hypothetical protein
VIRSRQLLFALAGPLLVFATIAADASAAPPREPGLGGALTGEARDQWIQGKQAYQDASDDKGYERALVKFRRAYELIPDSRLLFNIAACEKQLRHYGDTVRDLRKYMQMTPSLTQKERDLAVDLLKTLEPYVSELTVVSSTDGVAVSIDDAPLGTTPITGTTLIESGKRHVHGTKDGMKPFDQILEVAGGGPSSVNLVMIKEVHQAHLAITATDHAVIEIDGKPVGADGHYDGFVDSGTHSLRVQAQGKAPHDEQITLVDNEPRTMTVTLDDEPHKGVPAWIWVAGGVVVAGGLATAGYFLFKPGDIQDHGPLGNLSPGSVMPSSRLGVFHFQ